MTRSFDPSPLEASTVDQLLRLAVRAPSAGFSQGSHFVALSGESVSDFWTISGLGAHIAERQPGVLRAPTVILAVGDPGRYMARYAEPDKAASGLDAEAAWPVPYWLTDTAMAVENLLLLAEASGLGALYFGVFRHADRVGDHFGVPSGMHLLGAVALGRRSADDRPTGSPTRRTRRPLDEVIHHERW